MLKNCKGRKKFTLIVWNIIINPAIVYNTVEELVYLSKANNFPKTQAQTIKIGVEMIRKTHNFETGHSEWFERPEIQHMW